MKKCKRGYTLLELIIVINIVLILGSITLKLSMETIRDYFNNIDMCYIEDKFDNALLNIDVICNSNGIISIDSNLVFDDALNSDITSDNIVITDKDTQGKLRVKIIFLKGEKLMVKTLNYQGPTLTIGNNVILDDIVNFKVNNKGKLIYYLIESKKAGVRARCI